VEPDDVEQGDSASVASTTPIPITSVGLQDVSMRESRLMSTEVAGPVTTHPQLLPEGGHPPLWVDAAIQGLLALTKWGLPWDTPVDLQTRLIAMWLVLPMLRAQPILQRYRQQVATSS